jgi:ABC-2 type transport system permease protein
VNVYFRDTQHLLEVVLMAWFWATPIVYSYRSIADRLALHGLTWLLFLNPITPIVLTFQRAIYGKVNAVSLSGGAGGIGRNATSHGGPTLLHILPAHGPLWYLAILSVEIVVSVGLLLGALIVFGRLEGNFAEEL